VLFPDGLAGVNVHKSEDAVEDLLIGGVAVQQVIYIEVDFHFQSLSQVFRAQIPMLYSVISSAVYFENCLSLKDRMLFRGRELR
jgi:hypothetical protein